MTSAADKVRKSRALRLVVRHLLAAPVFALVRTYTDQVFLATHRGMGERPMPLFGIIHFLGRSAAFCLRTFRSVYTDLALEKYHRYIDLHYSKGGRGYFAYDALTRQDKLNLFNATPGSVDGYITSYPQILNYRNGDSFLDLGCGRGPNIKSLQVYFDRSAIAGYDINPDAVDVITSSVSHSNITAGVGDVTDVTFLRSFPDGAYDHIVLSHVFALLIGPGLDETYHLRQAIVEELTRIAQKTILIIDGSEIISPATKFMIEQKHRGSFAESILPYFDADKGTAVILAHGGGYGVLFIKQD